MSLQKELYFPTPIYFVDLDEADALNLYLKNRIYSWRDQDQNGIVRSNVRKMGAWHSQTSMQERPEYQLFVQKVSEQLQQVFVDHGYCSTTRANCLNMWVNINPQFGYNRGHTHPGSLWSGVYYVQTPLDCGQIIFDDPRSQAGVMQARTQGSLAREQWSEVRYEAKAGRLILFPSWLRHEVEPNLSGQAQPEGDRISIAFNYGQANKQSN